MDLIKRTAFIGIIVLLFAAFLPFSSAQLEDGSVFFFNFEEDIEDLWLSFTGGKLRANSTDMDLCGSVDGLVGKGLRSNGTGFSTEHCVTKTLEEINVTGDMNRSASVFLNYTGTLSNVRRTLFTYGLTNGEFALGFNASALIIKQRLVSGRCTIQHDFAPHIGNWTQLGYSFHNNGTQNLTTFYVNGKNIGTTACPFDINTQAEVSQFFTAQTGAERLNNATIDLLGLWNRTLSDAEFDQLYNEGLGLDIFTGFVEQDQTANNTALDTSYQSFTINVFGSNLNFDTAFGIMYYGNRTYFSDITIEGENYIINNKIDLPPVDADTNITYFWDLTFTNITDVVNQNTSDYFIFVSPSNLSVCVGSANIPAVNYTYVDEEDSSELILVSPGAVEVEFEWWLGTGTERKNNSFIRNDGSTPSHEYCINSNENFKVNTDYLVTNGTRFFDNTFNFINESLTNETKFKLLGLSNDTDAELFTIKSVDEGAKPLVDWLIQIYRKNIGTGEYILVGSALSDSNGIVQERLIQETQTYKVEFYNPSGTLRKTIEGQFFACLTTFCQIEFIVSDLIDPFQIFDDIEGYENNGITFDTDTNIFLFSWSDSSGSTPIHNLLVQRFAFNQSTIVCNINSSSLIGSLNCNVGNETATYLAQGYRIVGDDVHRVAILTIKVGDTSLTFNLEGLFWSFILLFTLIGIGVWNPPIGIILYLVGYTFLGVLGIIQFYPLLFFAQLIIGVLFIWAFKN